MQYSGCGLMRAEQRDTIPSLPALGTLLLMKPRMIFAFWAAKPVQLFIHENPKFFLAGPLSMSSSLNLYLYLGLPQLKCNNSHLALVNIIRCLRAHSSSLCRSLWMSSVLSHTVGFEGGESFAMSRVVPSPVSTGSLPQWNHHHRLRNNTHQFIENFLNN